MDDGKGKAIEWMIAPSDEWIMDGYVMMTVPNGMADVFVSFPIPHLVLDSGVKLYD